MQTTELTCDHVGDCVILRNESNDIVARITPESAVSLSERLLDCAGLALSGSK